MLIDRKAGKECGSLALDGAPSPSKLLLFNDSPKFSRASVPLTIPLTQEEYIQLVLAFQHQGVSEGDIVACLSTSVRDAFCLAKHFHVHYLI